jgi:tetratricopeptide (TPR) repeat protein
MAVHYDRCGLALTAADAVAVAAFDETVENFLAHARATPAALARVFEADGDVLLGWCAKGAFAFLLAHAELRPLVREAAERAALSATTRGATPRERCYVGAVEALARRAPREAIDQLEKALALAPDDAFAAKLSHALRFMLGDAAGMRGSLARVRARMAADHPLAGYLLGCDAFAHEETGDYRAAESLGREALRRAPRDAWGMHAVAHVYEMTGKPAAGIAWIEQNLGSAAHCNNFAAHVFWHLALFKLERGDHAAVLALYDRHIRADHTDDFRDIANGASLLARLELEGIEVGARWAELADIAERRIGDGSLAFADLHYCLALVGAGRRRAAAALAARLGGDSGSTGGDDVGRRIGGPIAAALIARSAGRHAEAAKRLLKLRPNLWRIGGSHAQRDVFEQLALDSAVRAGFGVEVGAILEARLDARGGNRFAEKRLALLARRQRHLGGAALPAVAAVAMPER